MLYEIRVVYLLLEKLFRQDCQVHRINRTLYHELPFLIISTVIYFLQLKTDRVYKLRKVLLEGFLLGGGISDVEFAQTRNLELAPTKQFCILNHHSISQDMDQQTTSSNLQIYYRSNPQGRLAFYYPNYFKIMFNSHNPNIELCPFRSYRSC